MGKNNSEDILDKGENFILYQIKVMKNVKNCTIYQIGEIYFIQ